MKKNTVLFTVVGLVMSLAAYLAFDLNNREPAVGRERKPSAEVAPSRELPPKRPWLDRPSRIEEMPDDEQHEEADPMRNPHVDTLLHALDDARDVTDERDRFQEALTASGQTSAPWTVVAHRLLPDWSAKIANENSDEITMSPVECYAAGCVIHFYFQKSEVYASIKRASDTAFPEWNGIRILTGVAKEGSSFVSSIILAPPNEL